MGVTPDCLPKDAKRSHRRSNEIVNEKRRITAETDLHLCAYFGLVPGYGRRVQLVEVCREAFTGVGAKSQAPVESCQQSQQSSRSAGRGGGCPRHGRAGVWMTTIGPWPTAAPAIAAGAKVPVGTRSTLNIQGPTQVAGAWWHWSEAGVLNGPLAGAPRRNFTGCSNANPRQSSPIQRPIAGSYLPIK